MANEIQCPRCRTTITLTADMIRTRCVCAVCGEKFVVPMPPPQTAGVDSPQDAPVPNICVSNACRQDSAVNALYDSKIAGGEVPPSLIKEYVEALEKVDVSECPQDFREARAQVIGAWRCYGETFASNLGGVKDSRSSVRNLLEGTFRATREVGSALEAYAAVLRRYGQSIDRDPMWRSSKWQQ